MALYAGFWNSCKAKADMELRFLQPFPRASGSSQKDQGTEQGYKYYKYGSYFLISASNPNKGTYSLVLNISSDPGSLQEGEEMSEESEEDPCLTYFPRWAYEDLVYEHFPKASKGQPG